MRVLHLFSNWKWTGPAEPAVNLGASLSRRHQVTFIPGGHPRSLEENEVGREAMARGVAPVGGYYLRKHFHPIHNLEDIMKLRGFLEEQRFDLIHAHMTNDHFIAACAVRALRRRIPIVRSFYDAEGLARSMRARWLLRHFTQGAVVITERARASLAGRGCLPPERVRLIPGAVDLERFDPSRVDREASRRRLALRGGEFVFVIVARMQPHRKFEVLLQAFKDAAGRDDRLRLMIVGRGTHQEDVARRPAREIGIEDRVLFPGYLGGQAFVETVGAADCALFIVPGSDGSCRAVREKMSLGLPVIAARVPPLDEMIEDGRTGWLVECTAAALAGAMLRAAGDPERTAAMGRDARQEAEAHYSLDSQALRVEECYQAVLAAGAAASHGTPDRL